MTTGTPPALVSLSDIAEVELFVRKRMREFMLGDHASVFRGQGFNFVGIRDWQPGDRMSGIDWAQSSLTNFSPLITREFEQDSTATVIAVADASLSTRCGAAGTLIATAIARSIAAVGLSSVLCQDMFGLVTFDDQFRQLASARPRVGKPHVVYAVDLYQQRTMMDHQATGADVVAALSSQLRKTTLVPVISDFLTAEAPRIIQELSIINTAHDVFLMMVDARFAYRVPPSGASWITVSDVETGQTRVISRREMARMSASVEKWQDEIERLARDADLDVVRIGPEPWAMETALVDFAAERRLRKL